MKSSTFLELSASDKCFLFPRKKTYYEFEYFKHESLGQHLIALQALLNDDTCDKQLPSQLKSFYDKRIDKLCNIKSALYYDKKMCSPIADQIQELCDERDKIIVLPATGLKNLRQIKLDELRQWEIELAQRHKLLQKQQKSELRNAGFVEIDTSLDYAQIRRQDQIKQNKSSTIYEKLELITAILRLIALQIDQHYGKRNGTNSKKAIITGLVVDVLRIINDILAVKNNSTINNSCHNSCNCISATTLSCIIFDLYNASSVIPKLLKWAGQKQVTQQPKSKLKSVEKLVAFLKSIAPSIEGILVIARASCKFDKIHSYKIVYCATALLAIIRAFQIYSLASTKNYQKIMSLAIGGITFFCLLCDSILL